MIVINSDAHSARTLAVIRYGVATARRAWLTKEHVANTRTWRQLEKLQQARARPLKRPARRAAPLTLVRRRRPGVRTSSIARNGELGTT